jgi:elongation factor G
MDISGADYYRCVQMIKDRLKANPVPIQLPIGKEEKFQGIVDLVEFSAYIYKGDLGREIEKIPIPEDMLEISKEYRENLIEFVAEQDESVLIKYLEGESITEEELRQCIRKATIKVDIIPVTCGSSYKNKGVQKLLDAILYYLPSPLDIPPIKGMIPGGEEDERVADDNAPFSSLAFKIMTDPYVGKLCFFRVYSGKITTGATLINSTNGKKERIGRILLMHANHREEVDTVYTGDIAAVMGLKYTTTGDTLCDENKQIYPILLP